jgi:hypothetical protein
MENEVDYNIIGFKTTSNNNLVYDNTHFIVVPSSIFAILNLDESKLQNSDDTPFNRMSLLNKSIEKNEKYNSQLSSRFDETEYENQIKGDDFDGLYFIEETNLKTLCQTFGLLYKTKSSIVRSRCLLRLVKNFEQNFTCVNFQFREASLLYLAESENKKWLDMTGFADYFNLDTVYFAFLDFYFKFVEHFYKEEQKTTFEKYNKYLFNYWSEHSGNRAVNKNAIHLTESAIMMAEFTKDTQFEQWLCCQLTQNGLDKMQDEEEMQVLFG